MNTRKKQSFKNSYSKKNKIFSLVFHRFDIANLHFTHYFLKKKKKILKKYENDCFLKKILTLFE